MRNMSERIQTDISLSTKMVFEKIIAEIKRVDDEYYYRKQYLKDGYHFHAIEKKTVQFLDGHLTLERRYYYNRYKKQGYYYIDDIYNVERYKRQAECIKEYVYNNVYNMPIRTIARNLGLTTTTIYKIISTLGKKEIKEHITPNTSLQTLYLQADEDHNKLQHPLNKVRSMQSRLIMLYENRVKICKGRYALTGKHYFLATSRESHIDFWEHVNDYITVKYPNVKKIYFGADGGAWIKRGLDILPKLKTIYIYDHFHVHKAIKSIFARSESNKAIAYNIIKQGDMTEFAKHYYKHVENHSADDTKYKFKQLKTLLSHWKYIRRNFTLKDYYGTSAEGHISHYLSRHLSSRPKAFAPTRLKHYLKILEYKLNDIDYDTYNNAVEVENKDYYIDITKPIPLTTKPYSNASSIIGILNHSCNTGSRKAFAGILNKI